MTEEAKAERREAALKAAESRTKDWGKRLDKGRQASQTKSTTAEVRISTKNKEGIVSYEGMYRPRPSCLLRVFMRTNKQQQQQQQL